MADTSVTGQTLIDNSLARQKDPDKTQWSDTVMLSYVKQGVGYVHKTLINILSELAEESGTITLAADTQEYSLSGNLDNFWEVRPDGVYFAGYSPLYAISADDAKREGTTTTDVAPTCFYITGNKIGLVNIPTATSVGLYPTLSCRYFAMEPTVTLGSDMPYKNLFNDAISAFASSLAVVKTEAPAQEYTAVYNALEESTVAIAKRRGGL